MPSLVSILQSFEQVPSRNDDISKGSGTRQLGRPFKFTCDVHVDNTVHLYCETCSLVLRRRFESFILWFITNFNASFQKPICEKCALLNHSTGHRIQYLQQTIDGSRTVLGSLIAQSRYCEAIIFCMN